MRDITYRRALEAAQHQAEELFRLTFDTAPIGVGITDVSGTTPKVIRANSAYAEIVGYDVGELLGLTIQSFIHPNDWDAVSESRRQLLAGEIPRHSSEVRVVRKLGDELWCRLSRSVVFDAAGVPRLIIGQLEDISERRANRERIRQQSLTDSLTGLANRQLLMDRLGLALARSGRSANDTAVIFCDLDKFKVVNDRLGHEAGDGVLLEVASLLRQTVRPGDTVARLGGDEFVIVADELPSPESSLALAQRLAEALLVQRPLPDGSTVTVRASIGVVVAEYGEDSTSVLRRADAAMYEAKRRGRGQVVGDPASGWRPTVDAELFPD
jgi:diguanylate cyclase (GGDEF)-like protein/PAS domain S-box-containing protein